jgi:transcriptional regulator with XRE-family HTH domain
MIIDLRTRMNQSQQSFATQLGVAINTIARYETGRDPSASFLARLESFAESQGFDDLADKFRIERSLKPMPDSTPHAENMEHKMFVDLAGQITSILPERVHTAIAVLFATDAKVNHLKQELSEELRKVRQLLRAYGRVSQLEKNAHTAKTEPEKECQQQAMQEALAALRSIKKQIIKTEEYQ